ncbi:MAG: PHP domain-containing protein [Candidatus Binataceae bacterium]
MSSPVRFRGIIHCHSHYSHDSLVSTRSYLRAARHHKLDFIILTDHDSVAGARELKSAAARQMPELTVPLAAEYLTDQGDVIAAFIEQEIRPRNFADFIRAARDANAVLMLPHPYVGHRSPERIAERVDLIEVVNCRTSSARNARALELANSLGKPVYAGSDAHFARSIDNAIVELDNLGTLSSSLTRARIGWAPPRFTSRWEYGASQLIKAWKRGDARLALRLLRGACVRLLDLKRASAAVSSN